MMDAVSIQVFAMILLLLGIYCILVKRNAIKIIIGIEIMAKGVTLNFIGIGGLSQSMVIIIILIEVVVAALALSLAINVFRHYQTLDVAKLTRLRW